MVPRDPETCMPGAIALLAKHTDWRELARPLFTSPNHVSSMQRWERKAREMNPDLTDEQVERLAQLLKKRHYALMTRRSAEVRRANRDRKAAAAESEPEPAVAEPGEPYGLGHRCLNCGTRVDVDSDGRWMHDRTGTAFCEVPDETTP